MTETLYIQSASSLLEKCTKIELVISGLYDLQIAKIVNSDVKTYKLDDGQMKIETEYRSAEDIADAITSYERICTRIRNTLNGRNFVLRDAGGMR